MPLETSASIAAVSYGLAAIAFALLALTARGRDGPPGVPGLAVPAAASFLWAGILALQALLRAGQELAALAEVAFLTRGRGLSPHHFMQLLHRGLVKVDFDFDGEWRSVGKLLEVYSNLPMSLADACLVRMSELHARSVVFTLDRDFLIYRKNRRLKIPLLAPFA